MIEKYINKVINSDCAMFLQQLPTSMNNLIILTDVPYGKNVSKGTNGFGTSKNRKYTDTWDNEKLSNLYFEEMKRVAKNIIIKVAKKYIVKQQGFVKDSKDEVFHPTQKPTELFEMIIRDFTKPDDIILDPFAGSGTTAIAAIRNKRKFILIGKEKPYCTIAEKRITNEMNKTNETCYIEDLELFKQ